MSPIKDGSIIRIEWPCVRWLKWKYLKKVSISPVLSRFIKLNRFKDTTLTNIQSRIFQSRFLSMVSSHIRTDNILNNNRIAVISIAKLLKHVRNMCFLFDLVRNRKISLLKFRNTKSDNYQAFSVKFSFSDDRHRNLIVSSGIEAISYRKLIHYLKER